MLTEGSGTRRTRAPTTCTRGESTLRASLNSSLMFWERGRKKSNDGVFSVSKQEQPVTTGQRTATGCLCQEKGQWEPRREAAKARSWNRLLGRRHVSRTEHPGDGATGRHAGPREAPVQTLPPAQGSARSCQGSQETTGGAEELQGEIVHQIPTVWKDSSLRGSGPQCRPKPSEWLPSLGLASLQRSVCVCGMCVHVCTYSICCRV